MEEHEEKVTRIRQSARSAWRDLVAVCSLPGIAVLPIAVLNNSWALLMRVQAGDHVFSGRVTAVAQPFEAGFGAALAATAVTLISARMGQRIGKGRTLIVLWGAAVLGGLIAARVGDRLLFALDIGHAEHSPLEWLWTGLLFLAMLAAVVSLGVFHFFGLPYLLAVRLMRGEVVTGSKLAIWVAASAILGGLLLVEVWDRWLGKIGASFEGPGDLTLFVGTYFSWGAGLAAYLAYRGLLGRGLVDSG